MSVNSILWFFGLTESAIIPCFSQIKIVPFGTFGHLLWKMHVPQTTHVQYSRPDSSGQNLVSDGV